jgi:hypothetical protein
VRSRQYLSTTKEIIMTQVIATPKDLKARVDEITHEDDDTYFVWLKRGWAFEPSEDERVASHCSGMFETLSEVRQAVRFADKCPCQYCKGLVD